MENSNQNNEIEKKLQTLEHYSTLKQESSKKLINILNDLEKKGYTIERAKTQSNTKCLEISSKETGKSACLLIHRKNIRLWKKSKCKDLGFQKTSCYYTVENITSYIEDTKQKLSIKEFDIKEIDNLRNELDFYKKMRDDKVNGPKAIELVNQVFQELTNNGYKIKYSEKNDNNTTMIISKKDISFSSYIYILEKGKIERDKKKFQLGIQFRKDNDNKTVSTFNLNSKNFEKRKIKLINKLNQLIEENSKESKFEYQEKKLNNDSDKKLDNRSNNKVSKEESFSEIQEKVKIKKENKPTNAEIYNSLRELALFLTFNGIDGSGSPNKTKHCTAIEHNLNQEQDYNPGDVIEINFKFDGVDCMISLKLPDKCENNDLPMAMVQYSRTRDMDIFKLMDFIKEFKKVNETNVLNFGYSAVRRIQKEQKTIKKETFSEFGESDSEGQQPRKKQCTEEKKGTGDRGINLGKQSRTEPIVQEQQFQQK